MYLLLILLLVVIGFSIVCFKNRVSVLKKNRDLVAFVATLIATFVGVFAAIHFAEHKQQHQKITQLTRTLSICVENLDYYKGYIRNIPLLFSKMKEMPDISEKPASLAAFIRKNPISIPNYISSLLATDQMAETMSPESFTQLIDSRDNVLNFCKSLNEVAQKEPSDDEFNRGLELFVVLIANLQQILIGEQRYQKGELTLPEMRQLHRELIERLADSGTSIRIFRDKRDLIKMGSSLEKAANKSIESDKK